LLHSSDGGESQPPKKGQIVDLTNLPDNVVIASGAVRITDVDVPLYLPSGYICGKARVVEGDDEDAVLIEVESSNPMVASLFKSEIIGLSLVYRPSTEMI
jgi:hypothetical protein